jgi:hypothetical protein
MRQYSNFRALLLSFYSRDLYREVARTWKGAGLLYQLLVVALATVVVAIRLHIAIAQFQARYAQGVVEQIPAITIAHGVVSVNVPTPYTIRDPKDGKTLAIIDTTGQVTSLTGTEARVLLTRDKLVMKKGATETRVYDLSRVENFRMDRARATRWLSLFAGWFALACAPFMLAWFYLVRLILMLIFAAIALLAARVMRTDIGFAAAMRLTAVALTPAALLEVVLNATGTKPHFMGAAWTLISAAYLVFALRSVAGETQALASGPGAAPPADGTNT